MSQMNSKSIASDDPRHQFHEISVFDVIRETADSTSFVFDIPDPLVDLFGHKPGQFFTFEIPWESFHVKRCYSLSSTASWGEKPKVTVKRVDDGRVSNWMNDNLKPGDRMRAMPPAGAFVLHEHPDEPRPLTLFGGGSGITPVISLLKQALLESERSVKLIYANRDRESVIFHAELEAIADQYAARIEVFHHLDSESGFLSEGQVVRLVEDRLDSDFYICGPTPFMDTIEHALKNSPLRGGEVHIERFVSAVDPDRVQTPAEQPAAKAVPKTVSVSLGGAIHEVEYRAGETILAAAIRAGLDVPYSCQDGYCSCCMARLRQGEVFMASREALTDGEIEEGWILTCQAKPTTGSCAVEYED